MSMIRLFLVRLPYWEARIGLLAAAAAGLWMSMAFSGVGTKVTGWELPLAAAVVV
jgi:hypothetical protein